MKVVIIDDELALLKMYSMALTSAGMEVVTASDGLAGLEIVKEQKPDIVLLDIIMPKCNGLDILKTIKENPEIKDIPVVLLTNLPKECSEEKAKELGAIGYNVKAQTEPAEVVNIVNNALKK